METSVKSTAQTTVQTTAQAPVQVPVHVPVPIPSATILGEIGLRAFKFIFALGTHPEIREVMAKNGYTNEDNAEGWKLIHAAGGGDLTVSSADHSALDAINALDEWDEVGFHKAHAALSRRFPEQSEFLFYELAASQGPTAMLGITKFLDRIDTLEKGRTSATEDADKKSVLELAARGIDASERARLRGLVDVVQNAQNNLLAVTDPTVSREQALGALYAWYTQWTEVAHAVVTERPQQIVLGIAKRRSRTASAAASPVNANAPIANANAPVVNAPAAVVNAPAPNA